MQLLKRIDQGLARGEAVIAAFILLSMILLAATQAVLYNVATRLGQSWANDLLLHLDWVDAALQRGTLWLAFVGASLATHEDRHIAIDVMGRILPGRLRLLVRSIVMLAAGVTCFYLSRIFYLASLRAQDRPIEYEVLTEWGQAVHICDAPASAIGGAELERPSLFCAARWLLDSVGVRATEVDGTLLQIETPLGALQLIVPVMFLIMALRFTARGVSTGGALVRGDGDGRPSQDDQDTTRRRAVAPPAIEAAGEPAPAPRGERPPTRKIVRKSEVDPEESPAEEGREPREVPDDEGRGG